MRDSRRGKPEKPTTAGAYWVKSVEIEGEWTQVEIVNQKGILTVVDCPYLGIVELDSYHHGLINIEWRRDAEGQRNE